METTLTKSQEVDVLRKFVASLEKGSYLATIFADAAPEIEGMIANDFAYSPLGGLRNAQAEMQKDLEDAKQKAVEVKKQRDALAMEVKHLERRKNYLKDELAELRQRAQRLAAHG